LDIDLKASQTMPDAQVAGAVTNNTKAQHRPDDLWLIVMQLANEDVPSFGRHDLDRG
jgi:hypothetical protein